MYDDLVKRLRVCPDYNEGCVNCLHKHALGCRTTTMHEAADAIEDLEFACNRYEKDYKDLCAYLPKWIPVTERLPKQGKRYLVIRFDEVTKTQFIDILWHDAHDLWWNRLYKRNYNVTHWMPLPEPPEVDADA